MVPARRSLTRSRLRNQNVTRARDADVHPRNHQHMVSTRALEVHAGGAIDERIFTNHHGVHQRGFAGRPQGVDLVDAAMDSGAPEFSPAAGKTGKNLDARSFGRG